VYLIVFIGSFVSFLVSFFVSVVLLVSVECLMLLLVAKTPLAPGTQCCLGRHGTVARMCACACMAD